MKNLICNTKYGKFVGRENAKGVIEFKGIPYAKTPRRWKEAEKPELSDKVYEAYDFALMCIQPYWEEECRPEEPQSEDCLKLNICTADIDKKGKPVMVFIHGGCYISGNPACEPYYGDQLVADNPDIVFVNFGYRLGIFGGMDFSSIDVEKEYENSINLTTKDQIRALEWIKENIECFGGDPNNITLFGQSAGSYSISVLTTIPEAVKLFNKGICESGVFDDNSINDLDRAAEMGKWFIEKTGIKSVEELETLDAESLREIDEEMFWTFPLAYSPVRDGKLIPFDTYGAFVKGIGRDIKLMMGNTEGDGERIVTDNLEEHRQRAINTVHPDVLTEETLEAFVKNDISRPKIIAYQEAVTDVRYRLPVTMLAEQHCRYNDVYLYWWRWCAEGYPTRAPHCIELPFVMDKLDDEICLFMEHGTVQGKNPPKSFQRQVQNAWVNFARNGNPSFENVVWPAYNTQTRATMIIDEKWQVEYDFKKKDRELFMPLYPEIRKSQKI